MRHYLGQVHTALVYDSDARARELADQASDRINGLGGQIEVGLRYGQEAAYLLVQLPDDVTETPEELVGSGVQFQQVHVSIVPAVEDQGIE